MDQSCAEESTMTCLSCFNTILHCVLDVNFGK